MVWTNSDGLQVMFGTEAARANKVGAMHTDNGHDLIRVQVDTAIMSGTTQGKIALIDNVIIPQGALIISAKLVVLTAFTSGGAATLDLGLMKLDGTELDFDGFVVASALSTINAVGKQVTGAGALIAGVALTAPGVVAVKANAAAYTAGKAELIVEYKPGTAV